MKTQIIAVLIALIWTQAFAAIQCAEDLARGTTTVCIGDSAVGPVSIVIKMRKARKIDVGIRIGNSRKVHLFKGWWQPTKLGTRYTSEDIYESQGENGDGDQSPAFTISARGRGATLVDAEGVTYNNKPVDLSDIALECNSY